jgi:hypothetical protein
MNAWNSADLARIAAAAELTLWTRRPDGTLRAPLPIWVVRDEDDLYIRSYKGETGAWYQAATASHAGRVRAGGVEADVEFAIQTDTALNDRIDAAYHTKYHSYGAAYVGPMTAPAARATTLKVTPRRAAQL